ncbi:MAG: FAD-binding protein [Bacillota bacterium]|nr:FAD-binding protein [Bacillota bacterium]
MTTILLPDGRELPLLQPSAVVVGSGAAGYNAVNQLARLGVPDPLLVTEGREWGTSRNTGSDKQTYYKLSLAGSEPDSVRALARDLEAGGAVHGDSALVEAAGSAAAFLRLVELGVPFPTNAAGEFVGYRTDHDTRGRATSAGPLTSRYMVEALEAESRRLGIRVLDDCTVVDLVRDADGQLAGLLAIERSRIHEPHRGLLLIACRQVILATGGPAACYRDSVFPPSQTGMSGFALAAGAVGNNLDQWQYGLASSAFRWNVSGSYQQVLPRYVSVDSDGREHDFLLDALGDPETVLRLTFLKGYEWPFDSRKIDGSSQVDLLVLNETLAGRRVYLDYRRNPTDLSVIPPEARHYLESSGATQETPFLRLAAMNPAAIDLYRANGIDLETQALEIHVAAQHHNGGLAVDADGRTTIPGLYAAGEVAGSFGLYRPGGSALNQTQVLSARAAAALALDPAPAADPALLLSAAAALLDRLLAQSSDPACPTSLADRQRYYAGSMSEIAAILRDPDAMAALAEEIAHEDLGEIPLARPDQLIDLLKLADSLRTMRALLSAMLASARRCGSRGAALVLCPPGTPGALPVPGLPGRWHRGTVEECAELCLETSAASGTAPVSHWRPLRPCPEPDTWFESVWRDDRARRRRLAGRSGR